MCAEVTDQILPPNMEFFRRTPFELMQLQADIGFVDGTTKCQILFLVLWRFTLKKKNRSPAGYCHKLLARHSIQCRA